MTRNEENARVSTLYELLTSSAGLFGANTAIMQKTGEDYVSFSYEKLVSDACRIGSALRKLGLRGKHIAICGKNSYAWVAAYFAVTAYCGVAVPLSKDASAEEISDAVKHCDVSAVICSDELADTVGDLVKIKFSELDGLESGDSEEYAPSEDDTAELAYTSGTDGRHKAAVLTHKNLCFSVTEMRNIFSVDTSDRLYSVLPLAHIYERVAGMLAPLYSGASVAYGEGIRHLTTNMRQVKPTVMLCVPLILDKIHTKIWQNIEKKGLVDKVRKVIKLSDATGPLRMTVRRQIFADIHGTLGGKLAVLITGGSAANPETIMGLREFGIRSLQGYGLTECAALISSNRYYEHEYASVGLPAEGGLTDIYNIGSDGIGEIRYKGDNVMTGYYKDPELTEKVIRGGWLYTGDMGYFDKNGYLHIVGRKSNMIVTAKRKQVYPEELEAELIKNPFVGDVTVTGVNNSEGDFDIVANIYPDPDGFAELYGDGYTKDDVKKALENAIKGVNARVASHKQIKALRILSAPPARNEDGKKIR